jgi:hypothetical protein
MEILGLALQAVEVLNVFSLLLNLHLKSTFPLDFGKFILVILVTLITMAKDIFVILNVSRSYHLRL